ncbi:MAG: phosphomannomutase/phosphoglucomutase [Thermodesulfobacteriota bacterium]
MKPINPDVFRAYDIRGRVDRDFDPEWVEVLGRALGAYFASRGYAAAAVGRDCRHSSPGYAEALAAGLCATGCDVVDLGMVPTPVHYYGVRRLGLAAGVMVTASHNPPQYNGFKVWAGAGTIQDDQVREVLRIMQAGDFPAGRGVWSAHDVTPSYVEELAGLVRLDHPVKVVVDGGNGAGGETCAALLRAAGAEVVPLFCEPDGDFPNHHPDPVIEKNALALAERVRAEGAACGIGLDGDGDRIGVVDEAGRMVYGDRLLALYAREALSRVPGGMVIGDVKCSHLLFRDIAAHGGRPLMARTGHSPMKQALHDTGALMAGEMSGHMFFNDRFFGWDDALYAALRLAEILSRAPGTPLSGLLAGWPDTVCTPEIRSEVPAGVKFQAVQRFLEHCRGRYAPDSIDETDGARIDFGDGWALVRASNTQSALTLRFEAESQARLAEIRRLVEEPLARIVDGLSPESDSGAEAR